MISKLKTRYREFVELLNCGPLREHLSSVSTKRLFIKFLYHHLIYKTPMIDYIQYEYYLRNRLGRDQYMDNPRLLNYMRLMNNPDKRYIFDNKSDFDSTFASYIGRDFIDCSRASYEDFLDFVKKNPVFFKKPIEGLFGHGVDKITVNPKIDLTKLFTELKQEQCICETFLSQHPEMAKFNSSSVNTLRIVTVYDGLEVNVLAGIARFGRKGRIADNFHHGGIACKIDVETGIVTTTGRNRNGERFVLHPDSKICFPGFQIPKWKEVITLVKKLALVVPDVKYVGWDIVLTEDSICVIEGNYGADPDIMQTLDQKGIWYRFAKYI